jgi:hypothetical protein
VLASRESVLISQSFLRRVFAAESFRPDISYSTRIFCSSSTIMADLKSSDSDIISSAGLPAKEINEKDVAPMQGSQQKRSMPRRQVSEWEALQIVAAGDTETIDKEVDEIDVDLQAMKIQSTWFKPQLRLKDPRYFTWLLVGMAL